MEDKPHVPGQTNEEFPDPLETDVTPPAPESPAAEPPKENPPKEDPKPEPAKDKEAEKPADQPKDKKRSIYDDYKEKKHEANEATARAEAAEAKVAELTALLDAKKDADTPAKEEKADDDLEAWAKEEGLTPQQVERFAKIIASRIPVSGLSDEDKQLLAGAKEMVAERQRAKEDQAILETAQNVKQQLAIHDDAELQAVMKEVVRLAHTPEFHDKEVDYIVWKNRDALAKMVSPKKPSFEPGSGPGEGKDTEADFSKGGVTPAMAQKSIEQGSRTSGYEVRQNR
jgi:hypothetical protein